MKLIDKAAVVAEIERRIAFFSDINNKQVVHGNLDCAIAFVGLRDFLDTLAVKEVDLDRAIDKWIDDAAITHEDCSITDIISTAKHFFELGLKTKGE